MNAHDYGKLAYFRGLERNPALDKNFCKAHLDGKDNNEQALNILAWLDGYDEEQLQMEDDS